MAFVTVLDYSNTSVHVFEVPKELNLETPQDDVEEWLIKEKGYKGSEIHYMYSENLSLKITTASIVSVIGNEENES